MKMALGWVKEYQSKRLEYPRDENWKFNNGNLIKQIQLDAMREGMRRAAETINPCSNPNCGNDECDLGRKILTAAEQLTTKDL